MNNEIKEITKVDKQLLDKIEHILASELNCEEYDKFYNYFNEIKKPSILIDIKDDENIKDYITNLQEKEHKANNRFNSIKGSCKKLGAKVENQREELKQLNKRLTNLQEKYEEADNDRHKLFEQKEKAIAYGENCLENLKDQEDYMCESIDIVSLLRMIHKNYIAYLQGKDKE